MNNWVETEDGELLNLANANYVTIAEADEEGHWGIIAGWGYAVTGPPDEEGQEILTNDFSVLGQYDSKERAEEDFANISQMLAPLRLGKRG